METSMRVVEADCDGLIVGTITAVNPDGTATVEWDTGHTTYDIDIDDLCPADGN